MKGRKKVKNKITSILFFCMLLFCFTGYTQTEKASTALSVKGTQLVNSEGIPVQLKGISTHGIAWFPEYINEECFKTLKSWNVNVIRLAMYTEESGGYCTDGKKEDLKSLIKKGVEYATKYDMYVIIDWHILSDGNPNKHITEAKAFFDEISKQYANQSNVIYEICNEPNGAVSWEEIKKYAQEVIAVIRKNDANNIILVGTPNWSQSVDQIQPLTEFQNIMYTLHFYAGTHKQELRNTMKKAIDSGLPLFVSEYGICDANGNGAIDIEQANEWIHFMNASHISYIMWNLSNKAESSAILKSNQKSNFTTEDLSDSGKWFYQMMTNNTVIPSTKNENDRNNSSTNDLTISPKMVAQWQEGDKYYYKYQVTIQNNSPYPKTQWNISLPFHTNITLVNGWNGVFQVNNHYLHIRNLDYNAFIASGKILENIGFILCVDKNISL